MMQIKEFPWKQFFSKLYNKVDTADLFGRAAQAAFYFSFSIFPLLLFLVSLFGLLMGSATELREQVYQYFGQVMPWSAYILLRDTVEEIVNNSSGSKLTVGMLVALWSASAGVDGIRSGLNAAYELKETRYWWRTKLTSLLLTLLVTSLAVGILAIVLYGWQLVLLATDALGLRISSPLVLVSIQWAAILLITLFACELIYNLLPDFPKFKWDWINPGSFAAVILWLCLSSAFKLYLTYFNTYNKTYGSLGAVIILMLWLYLTALVLMIGGAINSVVADLQNEKLFSVLSIDESEDR